MDSKRSMDLSPDSGPRTILSNYDLLDDQDEEIEELEDIGVHMIGGRVVTIDQQFIELKR